MVRIMLNLSEVKKNKHGIAAVMGGFLIHLTLGNLYSFGNIMTYMDSYMHNRVNPNVTFSNFIWVNAVATGSQGIFMVLGGFFEKRYGQRLACFLGSIILSSGIALTYFTIKSSFAAVILTYGFMAGLGIAIAYAIPLSCGMKWFPKRKGLVTGVIVGGFGLGSLGSTVLQTHYLNPSNIPVNTTTGYFEDPSLLDSVPNVFLLLGGVFFVLQIIGCALLFPKTNRDKNLEDLEDERLLINRLADQPSHFGESDHRIRGRDLTVREALKTKEFASFWLIFLFNCVAIGYINAMYKSFGQTFIANDFFLSRVGAFSAVFNFAGRVSWGKLMDMTNFKVSMTLMTVGLSLLLMTLPLTAHLGKAAFALWVWAVFFFFSGTFVLISAATAKAFGPSHYTSIYGLVFTQQLFSSIILACINQFLLSYGYATCFFLTGVIVLGGTAITMTLPRNL